MRYFLIVTIIFCLGCSTSSKTKIGPSSKPLGKTTGVILKCSQNPDQTFSKLVKYLEDKGFTFNQLNRFTHYLETNFKTMDDEMYTYQVDAVIPPVDSTIVVFRGKAIGPHVQSPAKIQRNSGKISRLVWDHFHTMVTGFNHDKIYYSQDL